MYGKEKEIEEEDIQEEIDEVLNPDVEVPVE
jgi:hypothetical protein